MKNQGPAATPSTDSLAASNEMKGEGVTVQSNRQGRTLLILLVILATALLLRSLNLDRGFWSDEIATYRGANQSFYLALIHRIFPLYYMICHFILYVTDAAWALRLPSVLFGVGGCAALFLLGRAVAGARAGLAAAALLAVSPYHILHSEDARYYALLLLLGLVTMLLARRALAQRSWDDVPWMVVAGNFFVLSHPFAVPNEFALGIGAAGFLLWDMRKESWPARIKALVSVAIATVAAGLLFWISGWATEFPMVVRMVSTRIAALGAPLLVLIAVAIIVLVAVTIWAFRRGVSPLQARLIERGVLVVAAMAAVAAAVWLVYFQVQTAGEELEEPPYRVLRQIPDDYIEDYEGLIPLSLPRAVHLVREGFFGEWGFLTTALTLGFALVGLVTLWRRGGPGPWLITAVLFVMPLPFFMVPFAHRIGPQYFMMQFAMILLLAGIGLADSLAALPRLLTSGKETPRTRNVRHALAWVLILIVLPTAVVSLGRIAEGSIFGRRDYGAFAGVLAKEMRGHDVLAAMIPADGPWTTYRQAEFVTSFAVNRTFDNPAPYFTAPRYNEVTTADRLARIRAAHPYAQVFAFCGEDEHLEKALQEALEEAGARAMQFAALRVWQVPPEVAPGDVPPGFTGPFNENGDIEASPPGVGVPAGWGEILDKPVPASVVEEPVRSGDQALRIEATAGDQANIGAVYMGEMPLPGREVLFGAWVFAPEPGRTYLQVIDSRYAYHNRMPVRANQWEFVVVRERISAATTEQAFAVTVQRSTTTGEAFVDDAMILLAGEDAPEPPPWDPASSMGLVPDKNLRGKRTQGPVGRFSTF